MKEQKTLSDEDVKNLFKSLDKIGLLLKKKMHGGTGNLISNLLSLMGLLLLSASVHPALPFFFWQRALIVKISMLAMQDLR